MYGDRMISRIASHLALEAATISHTSITTTSSQRSLAESLLAPRMCRYPTTYFVHTTTRQSTFRHLEGFTNACWSRCLAATLKSVVPLSRRRRLLLRKVPDCSRHLLFRSCRPLVPAVNVSDPVRPWSLVWRVILDSLHPAPLSPAPSTVPYLINLPSTGACESSSS